MGTLGRRFYGLCAVGAIMVPSAAWAQERNFDLPAQEANKSIPEFARQAGIQIIAPGAQLRGVVTPRVRGRYEAREALRILLRGQDLEIVADDGSTITLAQVKRGRNEPQAARKNVSFVQQPGGNTRGAGSVASTSTPVENLPVEPPQEIVVTARRVAENILSVPIAVTAIGGEDIRRLAVNQPYDLQKVSGLNIQPNGPNVTLNLRGQGVAPRSSESSVITYFAEAPNFPLTFVDLESVQVVKGPQGTLFGDTATGGVVLLTPKKPTSDLDGYIEVSGGNHRYFAVEGAVGGALIEDKLMVRAAVQHRERRGWMKTYYTDGQSRHTGDVDRTEWRLSLLARPTDNFENYTVVSGFVDKTNGPAIGLLYVSPQYLNPLLRNAVPASVPSLAIPYQFWTGTTPPAGKTYSQLLLDAQAQQVAAGKRVSFANFDRSQETKFFGVVNQTRWDVADNLAIRNIVSYSWTKTKGTFFDFDGSALPLYESRGPCSPGSTEPNYCDRPWRGGPHDAQFTEEFQLQGTFLEKRLQWQAGFYYNNSGPRRWLDSNGYIVIYGTPNLGAFPGSTCLGGFGADVPACSPIVRSFSKNLAGYGQATFAITPRFNLTAGYRSTWSYRRSDTAVVPVNTVPFAGTNMILPVSGRDIIPGSRIVSSIYPWTRTDSYNFSLDYKIDDDTMIYVAHRRGYKSGGVNASLAESDPNKFYKPETIEDVEIGIKSQWRIGGLSGTTSLSYYRDWYKDIQRSTVRQSDGQVYAANIAAAKIQGIELEGSVKFQSWFSLGYGFSYIDAKNTKWVENATCAGQSYRPQCVGLAPATPIVIDHVAGVMTVGALAPIGFRPDVFPVAPKFSWTIRPSVNFEEWVGEDISVASTIRHESSSAIVGGAVNTSNYAGVTLPPQATTAGILDGPPYVRPAFTSIDLRLDWRNIRKSNFSFALVATNVTGKIRSVASASPVYITGSGYSQFSEPRMIWGTVSYKF